MSCVLMFSLALSACSSHISTRKDVDSVSSFDICVAAGGKIVEGKSLKCFFNNEEFVQDSYPISVEPNGGIGNGAESLDVLLNKSS